MSENLLRLVIADDEPHVRAYLRSLAGNIPAEIVGEASNGNEAAKIFAELKPDLLLLDLNMPVKSGEEALSDIISAHPEANVIMLCS